MSLTELLTNPWTALSSAWLLTYIVHSSLILGGAWVVSETLRRSRLPAQETLWKWALVGGLVTASLQIGLGWRPPTAVWELSRTPPSAAVAGVSDALPAAAGIDSDRVSSPREDKRVSRARGVGAARRIEVPSETTAGSFAAFLTGLPWIGLLSLAWIAGGLLLALRLVASYLLFHRRLRHRAQVTDGPLYDRLQELLRESGWDRPLRLTVSSAIKVPIAWGILRPEICLPTRAVRCLASQQQTTLLAHELAHLLRRDQRWLLSGRLLESLFFLQPLNTLARRRLQEISEVLCDDWAVARTGRPVTLARCLTQVAGWGSESRRSLPAPSMAAAGSGLGDRVRRLLGRTYPMPPQAVPRWLTPLAAGILLTVMIAAPGFTRAPQAPRAEPAPEPPPVPEAPPAPPSPPAPLASELLPAPEAPRAPTAGRRWVAPIPVDAPAPPASPLPAPAPVVRVPPPTPAPGLPSLAPRAEARAVPEASPTPVLVAAFQLREDLEDLEDGVDGRDREEELEEIEELIEAELEAVEERLEARLEGLGEELERVMERYKEVFESRFEEGFEERLEVQLESLMKRRELDAAGLELDLQAELLAERARRMAEGGAISAEERESLRAEARRLAEEMRPSQEEMRQLAEEARRLAEQVKPSQKEMRRLHEEIRRELEHWRESYREELETRREELEGLREDPP